MLFFNRGPVVPVLRFTGPIGMATPLRPGLAMASVAGAIEKAFDPVEAADAWRSWSIRPAARRCSRT